jgi:hypothetical protein
VRGFAYLFDKLPKVGARKLGDTLDLGGYSAVEKPG